MINSYHTGKINYMDLIIAMNVIIKAVSVLVKLGLTTHGVSDSC